MSPSMYSPVSFLVALLAGSFVVVLSPVVADVGNTTPIYKDPAASIENRVSDLLSRMTLQEKIDQLHSNQIQGGAADGSLSPDDLKRTVGDGIGEIISWEKDAEQEIPARNAIQKYALEQTRLGIPVIFHGEACHGLAYSGTGQTSYPVPLGLASSWDEELYHEVYTEVAAEARSRGLQEVLAPVLDITRDPRWGRTDETMGEDGYLNGRLGIAAVEAFQGGADGVIPDKHVAVTLKHFVGHGEPQEGSNTAPANFPPRILIDEHGLPFRMVIAAARPSALMISYNEVDSVPNSINSWLMKDVLRKQFGFGGLIVSDYRGILGVVDNQHAARDRADAAAKAINAGMEVEFPNPDTFGELVNLVNSGVVKQADIDAAVAHVLALKFRLGLFEPHPIDLASNKALPRLQSTRDLALRAACESIILLKNKNNILPLAQGRYKTIALIGPNADACNLGGYSGVPLYTVSLIDGIKKKVGDQSQIVYAQGCAIDPGHPDDPEDLKRINAAVEVAKKADLIILALGDKTSICQETWPGRDGDRTSLNLYGQQQQLADAMFALEKPVVVYLMNGRPLAMPEIADKADAILEGWSMGQETGHAAADTLFGDVNPSGKLTITIPKSVGNLPCYYDGKSYDSGPRFIDDDNKPLFPFGFGLSYTTFKYSPPKLADSSITTQGRTQVSVDITNTGPLAGDEIAQMYVHPRYSSVTRPVKMLRGFVRLHLAPGETKTAVFPITPDLLSYHDINMNYGVEPTDLDVMVGPSSTETQNLVLKITP